MELNLLTYAGVYLDDSQIDRLTITRGPVEPGGSLIVEVSRMSRTDREAP